MKGLIRHIVLSGLCLAMTQAFASGATVDLSFGSMNVDHSDQASLQRGAKYYMNYCSGCHSLRFMRYQRMANDIGITQSDGKVDADLLKNNLIFTNAKIADQIHIGMKEGDAAKWFGVVPPDLSLETRARGEQWVYDYLQAFYVDPSRPWGVNNLVYDKVAMPNVLAELQGVQTPVYRVRHLDDGKTEKHLVDVQLVKQGQLTPAQFRGVVYDIVNFLSYVGNPVKTESRRIGTYVLLFLTVLFALSWALKREYWKDVH